MQCDIHCTFSLRKISITYKYLMLRIKSPYFVWEKYFIIQFPQQQSVSEWKVLQWSAVESFVVVLNCCFEMIPQPNFFCNLNLFCEYLDDVLWRWCHNNKRIHLVISLQNNDRPWQIFKKSFMAILQTLRVFAGKPRTFYQIFFFCSSCL